MSRLLYADDTLTHFENVLANNVATMFINTVEDNGGFDNSEGKAAGSAYLTANWKGENNVLAPYVQAIMEDRGYVKQ
ncbi:MAG: hypothetical protein HRU12_21640 [Phaeodactylibacter sp.]|nr:hypothetical protein [Phaeodactylibacter sp.]